MLLSAFLSYVAQCYVWIVGRVPWAFGAEDFNLFSLGTDSGKFMTCLAIMCLIQFIEDLVHCGEGEQMLDLFLEQW